MKRLLKLRIRCAMVFLIALGCMSLYGTDTGGFAKVSPGGTRVTVDNTADFLDYVNRQGKYTIYMYGTFTLYEKCHVPSDKAIIGTAGGAQILGKGFVLDSVSNVVIENLDLSGITSEVIRIENGSKHIWVNQCTFEGNDSLCVDIRTGSDSITVSANQFVDCTRACVIGHSDTNGAQDSTKLRVTLHLNLFRNVLKECVLVRFSSLCHIYYSTVYSDSSNAIVAIMGAKVLVEESVVSGLPEGCSTQYGNSEEGYIEGRDNGFYFECDCGDADTNNIVPEPAYAHTTIFEKLPQYIDFQIYMWWYSGANKYAAAYNSGADYDGVGVTNHDRDGNAMLLGYDKEKAMVGYSCIVMEEPGGDNAEEAMFTLSGGNELWEDIVAYAQGAYIDIADNAIADGTFICMDEDSDDWMHFFRFQQVEGYLYRIINYRSEKCLEASQPESLVNPYVILSSCEEGNTDQMFWFSRQRFSSGIGLETPISETEISIYPNPAHLVLHIAVPQNLSGHAYSVKIINTYGKTVMEQTPMEGEINELDIGSFIPGIYIVQIWHEGNTYNKMLIKN